MAVTCEYTTTPHKIAPTTAGWAPITVGAGVWTNSAWVELIASTPGTGIAITGAVIQPRATILDIVQIFELELGTGAAASEVPFAVLAGTAMSTINYGVNACLRPHAVPYTIGAGVRVSCRLRKRFDRTV